MSAKLTLAAYLLLVLAIRVIPQVPRPGKAATDFSEARCRSSTLPWRCIPRGYAAGRGHPQLHQQLV